ncbi:DNA damage-inducible protein 1-like [Gossypium australe]|uniref:DNA damage-inducible protein 1-like n=1 Tax=Gossypium australe TaxID=47621 RepID=A0A5B6WER9_9ROSI|nr:DNA damage-inducible protein 1-like [Gossypium australe]
MRATIWRASLDQERKLAYSSDPQFSIGVRKVEEDLHVVQADVHQIYGQLDQVLKLLQNNLASSIPSNIEPNPKREG